MKKIFLLLTVVMLFASCTTTKKATPTSPINFQINLDLNDLDFIGEATGTSTQNYVLGIPIGGRKYKSGTTNTGFGSGIGGTSSGGGSMGYIFGDVTLNAQRKESRCT